MDEKRNGGSDKSLSVIHGEDHSFKPTLPDTCLYSATPTNRAGKDDLGLDREGIDNSLTPWALNQELSQGSGGSVLNDEDTQQNLDDLESILRSMDDTTLMLVCEDIVYSDVLHTFFNDANTECNGFDPNSQFDTETPVGHFCVT